MLAIYFLFHFFSSSKDILMRVIAQNLQSDSTPVEKVCISSLSVKMIFNLFCILNLWLKLLRICFVLPVNSLS